MAWKTGLACGFTATRSSGPQHREVERGHDRDERGRRRLVPADLQPVDVLAEVIGVVDHPAREPQHLLLELSQERRLRGLRRPALRADFFPGHGRSISAGWSRRFARADNITIRFRASSPNLAFTPARPTAPTASLRAPQSRRRAPEGR